jgi:hypothetical protein
MNNGILDTYIQQQQDLKKLFVLSPTLADIATESLSSFRSIVDDATARLPQFSIPNYMTEIASAADWIKTSTAMQGINSLQTCIEEQERTYKQLYSYTAGFDSLKKTLETSAAWNLHNTIEEAIGSTSLLKQQLEDAWGTSKWFQQEIESFNRFIPKIESYIANFPTDKISFGVEGTLGFAGQSFTIDEINYTVTDIINNIDVSEEFKIGFFELFFKEIDKLPKPLKIVLIWVIVPFIINITSGLATPYIKELLKAGPSNKQTIVREIKKKTPQHFDMGMLSNLRFVTATILFVREGPSQKTKILDELVLGQVVHILHKKKNWTRVGYTDQDTGEMHNGWVFTRHIKKFKK